jgi:hypothetical protein
MGATTTTLLEEETMGHFHPHNVLCGGMFARNVAEKVKEVAMKRISTK